MTWDWANNKAKQAYDGFVPSGEQYGFEGPGLQGGVLPVLEEQQVPVLRRQPHQAQRRDGGQRGTSHHQEVRVAPLIPHFRRVHC